MLVSLPGIKLRARRRHVSISSANGGAAPVNGGGEAASAGAILFSVILSGAKDLLRRRGFFGAARLRMT
jgi:nanoRNase/pAp phosphatase (c-di-AMP/oligoRNAs hydrolase)